MAPLLEVVITGVGIVSPIGIGRGPFWTSLCGRSSGIRRITAFDVAGSGFPFGGEIHDFDPKEFVKPRKSLKVMSREIQFGVVAAGLAMTDAGLAPGAADPERLGVVFGADMMHCDLDEVANAYRRCTADGRFDSSLWGRCAMDEIYPLWMLKYLPNMPACHIAIAHDARGPNNSHSLGESSSLTAIAEAARIIERGAADVMIAGGASSRIHPILWARSPLLPVSRRADDPAKVLRPFDAQRDGFVNGEGSGALILESRRHAEARGAQVLARVAGAGGSFEPPANGKPLAGDATRRAIRGALRTAGLAPRDLGHVNAHGLSTVADDRAEAGAIRELLGEVPVTAPKSYFGNLGAGTGAVEMAVSVLALEAGVVPVTLNYDQPDPECPINVVHREPLTDGRSAALILNQSPMGQSVAVAITR